jgi:hypothetical protein
MIYLNRLLQVLLLVFLLSIESTLSLPIFSLFLAFRLIDKFNYRDEESFYLIISSILLLVLAIALFYQLSMSSSLLIIAIYYFFRSLIGNKVFAKNFQQWQLLQLLLFAILQLTIFFLSNLSFNIFMFLQGLIIFVLLFFKISAVGKL